MTPALVSVIIPAFNVELYLADAVRSAIGQTWKQVELIIVDDGSSDGTGALADRLAAGEERIRVIHQRNRGVSAARNAGIAAANGEFVCFLDADDVLLPDKCERQVAFLGQFPDCDLPMLLLCRSPPLRIAELLTFRNWFAPMSPLLRAAFVARIGGFDEQLASSEDWDYWIRASQLGALCYLPGPVAVYRTHPMQATRNWGPRPSNIAKVIVKHWQPGSEAWGNSQARLAKMCAEREWGERRYLRMIGHLTRYAWYAKSRRRRRLLGLLLWGHN
jgi:glycosyltransferase involved in cell wall biosynthesis